MPTEYNATKTARYTNSHFPIYGWKPLIEHPYRVLASCVVYVSMVETVGIAPTSKKPIFRLSTTSAILFINVYVSGLFLHRHGDVCYGVHDGSYHDDADDVHDDARHMASDGH